MKKPDSILAFMQEAPDWARSCIAAMSRWSGIDWSRAGDSGEVIAKAAEDGRSRTELLANAEVFGSAIHELDPVRVALGLDDPNDFEHAIALDIDHEAILIESSTPGHYHLLVHHTVHWGDYVEFLKAGAKIGLLQQGYVDFAIARGETFIRAPWIRKHAEKDDVAKALAEWVVGQPPETPEPSCEPVF